MSRPFRVAIPREFLDADGTLQPAALGLDLLDAAEGVEWEILSENPPILRADQLQDFDALLLLTRPVTADSLAGVSRLSVIARFGVGYDNVDVEACTRNGIILTITPDGVRRPVAVGALTLMLALSHKLFIKDQLTREGRWNERSQHAGMGLTGRTLGVVGLGNIGRELLTLCRPLEMKRIGYDPYVSKEDLAGLDVELADLDDVLQRSDFVILCCALTDETRRLIDAGRLARMKPSAYLINVARGPVVDQQALVEALRERRIQGAAVDVFEKEPIDAGDPLCGLDNVILTPHAICWTDEILRGNGRGACQSILDVASGRAPSHVVNQSTLEDPRFKAKLARYGSRGGN